MTKGWPDNILCTKSRSFTASTERKQKPSTVRKKNNLPKQESAVLHFTYVPPGSRLSKQRPQYVSGRTVDVSLAHRGSVHSRADDDGEWSDIYTITSM